MFRFEDPIYLWLLWIIPVLVLIRFIGWRRRKAKLRKFGDPELLKQLMPGISKIRPTVKFSLMLSALALLIIMVARPQMGSKISHDKRHGIETIICLDISNSMLAEDVVPSRLDKSKMMIENLVDNFTNDKIGLIVFAGDAFVQLPITSDYVSAKMFLQNINPSLIQSQGTNIGQAISLACKSFTQQENVGRAIIVITDGENHEPGATEAAQAAKKAGINVFILGIGDTKGAPIPMGDGSYMKDNTGNTVMTALNENMCKELAQAGSGQYIHVDNTSDAEKSLNNALTRLQKGDLASVIYSEYAEQFQAVGILVILLLILEICLLDVKNPLLRNVKFFGKTLATKARKNKKLAMLVTLMLLTSLSISAQNDRNCIRQGNRSYKVQKWTEAETQYRKAFSKNGKNPQAVYNLGCALLMQQKDSAAMQQFQGAAQLETNKLRRAASYHNMGVIMQNHREYAKAIDCYKMALRCNPSDNQTRYNLALCKKLLKNQPQQNQNKNDKNNKDKNNKDKNKNNKDKDKDKQNQNKNDQDKNKDNKNKNKDNNQQKNQPNQDKMSKENAEQLLNAAVQQEQATKQKLQKAMSQPRRNKYEKNW